MLAARLKARRRELDDDRSLRGSAYGRAPADAVDETLREAFGSASGVALVALGSYARQELCPGSDLDVLLVLSEPRRLRRRADHGELAERLWYPLWDAGFTTGHGARTVRESLQLAESDLDVLTALLGVRPVAGDAALADALAEQARQLCHRLRDRVLAQLRERAEQRRVRPGPIAEMLEPNLKDGAGGLRDVHTLAWAGDALGEPGGLARLVADGVLDEADALRVRAGSQRLLDVRVELHRHNGGRSDLLVLQDQDAVAAGDGDADRMVRDLAATAREIAWIVGEVLAALAPTAERRVVDRALTPRLVVRGGRLAFVGDGRPSALDVLEGAASAAEHDVAFERATLTAFAEMTDPEWDVWQRAAFGRLLRQGARAVPVFVALDHAGVLVRLLPEWEHVRALPQRNAYHRFTVDRHLLEAVAECATLLDLAESPEPRPVEGTVARACRRPELLLIGALLHDLGKGLPGDHSQVGAEIAARIARRIGLDSEGVEIVVWLARDHLVMADTATRRDLSDAATVRRFAEVLAGDGERLRLLYLLTIGDSIATGSAAWSRSKAALVRDLFVKAATFVESDSAETLADERRAALAAMLGDAATATAFLAVMPPAYVLAFDPEQMVSHRALLARREFGVTTTEGADGRVTLTVAAPDRSGLLATVAGALTTCGLAVHEASLFSTTDGMALDVFRADDPFGRYAEHGSEPIEATLRRALAGELDLAAAVADRREYRPDRRREGRVDVTFDLDASETATVVEVHCDDRAGLLYELAGTLTDLDLDVTVAKVQTLGDRVIDTFYVRDVAGKVDDRARLETIESALRARLVE